MAYEDFKKGYISPIKTARFMKSYASFKQYIEELHRGGLLAQKEVARELKKELKVIRKIPISLRDMLSDDKVKDESLRDLEKECIALLKEKPALFTI